MERGLIELRNRLLVGALKHPTNKLVTKMVANAWPRTGSQRDQPARAADFSKTNQYLSAQNETGRDARQQISSLLSLICPASRRSIDWA